MIEDSANREEQGQRPSNKHTHEEEMTFFDHLHVLRRHLFRMVIALIICSIAVFAGGTVVFDYVVLAPTKSNFLNISWRCYFIKNLRGGGV